MWILYQVSLATALLVAAPFLLVLRGRHYLPTIGPRLGLGKAPADPAPLWIHAVSVGEVGVLAALGPAVEPAVRRGARAVVTTVTPTGQERALALCRRGDLGAEAGCEYLPFDFSPPTRRFLRRYRPQLLVLVEGDYWPLLLRHVRRQKIPVVVVNGRISDRSFRRLWRLRRLTAPLFDPVARFGMQTEADRERLLRLGVSAERVEVTGNLKFESPEPSPQPTLEAEIRRLAAGRPILVAGSTMPGEEELVLEAFLTAGGPGRALLIVAPRHPERFDRVAQLIAAKGIATARRSRLGSRPVNTPADVLLLDSLGELGGVYRLARGAFIGGTLAPRGGHNPLEAARFGVPVVVGPSMENFREIAAAFDRAQAWRRVEDRLELSTTFRDWLDSAAEATRLGARGLELVERNRGALERTARMLRPFLDQLGGPHS